MSTTILLLFALPMYCGDCGEDFDAAQEHPCLDRTGLCGTCGEDGVPVEHVFTCDA